jgi:hypothetical protein
MSHIYILQIYLCIKELKKKIDLEYFQTKELRQPYLDVTHLHNRNILVYKRTKKKNRPCIFPNKRAQASLLGCHMFALP